VFHARIEKHVFVSAGALFDPKLNAVEMSEARLVDPDFNSFALEDMVPGANGLGIKFEDVAVLGAAILTAIVDDSEAEGGGGW